MLHLPQLTAENKHKRIKIEVDDKPTQFNVSSLLWPHVLQVLFAFHLLYEEIKLNTLLWSDLRSLSTFLYQVSKDLQLGLYVNHYWLDFPTELSIDFSVESQIPAEDVRKLSEPSYFNKEPPNVFSYLNAMLKDLDVGYYPYLAEINNRSKDMIDVSYI